MDLLFVADMDAVAEGDKVVVNVAVVVEETDKEAD